MKIPKIGKRGWLGVVLFAMGLLTFFGATNQAQTEMEQSSDSVDERTYQNVVAKGAGYDSFTDALADQNRKSGSFFIFLGAGLTVWGFKRYNGKKPDAENKQTDKPAA
jgi:hypothetical protein